VKHLRAFWRRLGGLVHKGRHDRDTSAELESHVQLHVDDEVRAGRSPEEARRRALIALGGLEQTKERYRDQRGVPMLDAALHDIRFALRALARRPLLLVATTISIGLGVGINIAVYSVLRGILFSPWVTGAAAPDRLVTITPGISFPNFRDLPWRDTGIEAAALQSSTLVWRTPAGTTTIGARIVSENVFDVFGIAAAYGRTFSATPSGLPADPVVLSFAFWKQRFGANPAVIGETLNLNGWPYTVVGVLPASFTVPSGPLVSPSVYVPIGTHVANGLDNRAAAQFDLLGTLAAGATREQALAALRTAAERLETAFPTANRGMVRRLNVLDGAVSPVRLMVREAPQGRMVLTLAAAVYGLVGLVLLIVCANVAGLLTARADERRHEIAVRIALGATRWRLVQQSLAESLVIAVLGCLSGATLWRLCTTVIPDSAMVVNAGIEIVAVPLPLIYCLGLVVVATIACGVAPALTSAHVPPIAGLRARRAGHVLLGIRLHHVLVGAQVAVSFVLLTAAFVLLHAFVRLRSVEAGYDVAHTASIDVRLPTNGPVGDMAALKRVIEGLPAVESVSYGSLPLSLLPRRATIRLAGLPETSQLPSELDPVGPRYLETMRIPLVRGRDLAEGDEFGQDRAVVVNQTFLDRYLGKVEPIGAEMILDRNEETGRAAGRLRVVGVARDVKIRSLGEEPVPVIYLPAAGPSMVVRVSGSGRDASRLLADAGARLLPGASITTTSMSDRFAMALMPARLGTLLLGALGGLGLLLATIGLHGIVSYATSRRTFEIGVRLALGATRFAVVWVVVRGAVTLVAVGSAVGLVLSLGVVQALRPLLSRGQSAIDPFAVLGVLIVLAIVGAASSVWPARRAASIDPSTALRSE